VNAALTRRGAFTSTGLASTIRHRSRTAGGPLTINDPAGNGRALARHQRGRWNITLASNRCRSGGRQEAGTGALIAGALILKNDGMACHGCFRLLSPSNAVGTIRTCATRSSGVDI